MPRDYSNVRKIIHVDMDAFFAAVEVRDNPAYKGKPLIVGGSPDSRGVVSTCSYEARKFGIHSAMSSSQAYRLCPQAIFVRGRFEAYREASKQILEIFFQYTDVVEPVSIDEAYLDVTFNKVKQSSATQIAKEIRAKIFEKTKLTASAGVSYNKFMAKIGSDFDKPDGLVIIPPERAKEILDNLAIGKFHGIGKVTEKKMINLGIKTGLDLRKHSLRELTRHFGKVGQYYYNVVRGKDNREVTTHRIRKSIGMERTFAKDIDDNEEMIEYLKKFCTKLSNKMNEKKVKAKTMTLKIRFANFDIISRSFSFPQAINDEKVFAHIARKLLLESLINKCMIRLLGISFSNLEWLNEDTEKQLIVEFYDQYPTTYDL